LGLTSVGTIHSPILCLGSLTTSGAGRFLAVSVSSVRGLGATRICGMRGVRAMVLCALCGRRM
jgi:hypothetical protein